MSVRKIRNTWWVDFRFEGIRYRKKSPDNSKNGALNYESLLRSKLSRGESINKETPSDIKQSFSEFAWYWYEHYVVTNNKYSERYSKKLILKKVLVPYFGKMPINKITTFSVEQFKSVKLKNDRSKKTINNYLTVLSKCLKDAHEWLDLPNSPRVKMFKVVYNERGFLTQNDIQLFLNHAEGVWYDMAFTALRTGLRLGELIGLRWCDIDFHKSTLTVKRSIVRNVEGPPKNYKSRVIPMSNDLIDVLNKMDHNTKYVFESRKGYPLSTNNCSRQIKKICELANIKNIGWHTLRHTFATLLASSNVPIISIKELMGHSDIKTTMRYSHLVPGALKDAINIYENKNNFGQHLGNAIKNTQSIVLLNQLFKDTSLAKIKENNPDKGLFSGMSG